MNVHRLLGIGRNSVAKVMVTSHLLQGQGNVNPVQPCGVYGRGSNPTAALRPRQTTVHRCVISTLHLLLTHQGIVGNGDDTLTMVTLWRSEIMELSDIGSLQTCLFLQLTQRTLLSTILRPR